MILGVTGGIATGKSTVSRMFQEHGAVVIDADAIAREVTQPGCMALSSIRNVFGEEVFLQDNSLNRKKLGEIIFKDTEKRIHLEAILHPVIRKKMLEMTRCVCIDSYAIVVWDVPLLIEKKLFSFVDKVILVEAPSCVQRERLMLRNALSEEEAVLRIRSQMPMEEKRKYADFIIDNEASMESTRIQVGMLWAEVTKKERK